MQQLETPEKLRESQVENETADVGDVENQCLLASTQLFCLKPNPQTSLPFLPHFPKSSKYVMPTNTCRSENRDHSVHQKHFLLFRLDVLWKIMQYFKIWVLNPHTSKFSDT